MDDFIEINNGISIRASQVCGVERIDDFSCKVLTTIGAYESVYPSWRIVMLVREKSLELEKTQDSEKEDSVNLWGRQYFAG